MENKILLNSKKSKYSVNKEENLAINLSSKSRIIPYNDVSTKFNLYNLYNEERDNSDKYRIILTVNPICSNVLLNMRTEVVKGEGGDNCETLVGDATFTGISSINNASLDWKQAIRDTEYTHPQEWKDGKPIVYHCGLDILNNHLLRQNGFIYVASAGTSGVFNTIYDYVRDLNGKTVEEATGVDSKTQPIHLYQYDTILTMYNAYINRVKEENGWYGFKNSANIDIPNAAKTGVGGGLFTINKIMNNNKPCEFIDFYPDRSLYSFIPKVNKYRHRVEKNWDYCLTYPYEKDYKKLHQVCQPEISTAITVDGGNDAIRIINAEVFNTASGFECVRFKSMFKHTIKAKDYITLFYKNGDTLVKRPLRIKIYSVGDLDGKDKDRYFSIRMSDIADTFGNRDGKVVFRDGDLKPTEEVAQFFYKKSIEGYDCHYYFRKFKKIDCNSEINKLAFGENIYGDRMAQIVFTDVVDTMGLVDHNGKPLTELYLTIIKRNKGYEEWYDKGNYRGEDVEFSHCFGKVTSGLDMPTDEDCYQYNVRRLHNVDLEAFSSIYKSQTKAVFGNVLSKKITPLEDDITISNDTFYGDIVEYDIINMKETVLEHVYYRFNTAQRETANSGYCDILYDRLDYDDYDKNINQSGVDGFKITSGNMNTTNYGTLPTGHTSLDNLFAGNIQPEGYYYNPHYKIKIKEVSEEVTTASGRTMNYKSANVITDISGDTYAIIQLSSRYSLIKDTIIGFYNYETNKLMWGSLSAFTLNDKGEEITVLMAESVNQTELYTAFRDRKIYVILTSNEIAPYATYLSGSHSFVWREIKPMSSLVEGEDLYSMPFTNGCHYINQNINLFLKRQDPRNEYFLLSPEEKSGVVSPLRVYKVWGWDVVDTSSSEYNDGIGQLCV